MAQPSVADVRVSCPACGGPVHPIAGRCKHCRTDLVAARGGATGAQGTMIQIGQLGARGKVVAPPSPSSSSASAPLVTPAKSGGLPLASAAPSAVGPLTPVATRPRSGLARRWPLVVAAVAAIAIVASIVVLVLGGDSKPTRKRRPLGPAPDRMQTDQLPTDPWARPGAGSGAQGQLLPGAQAPDLGGAPDDRPVPPPPPPPEDDELADTEPGGVLGGVVGGMVEDDPPAATIRPRTFLLQATTATCKRLEACWGDSNAAPLCAAGRDRLGQLDSAVLESICERVDASRARECLRQVATLPCPDQSATIEDMITMVYGLDPCMRACESP